MFGRSKRFGVKNRSLIRAVLDTETSEELTDSEDEPEKPATVSDVSSSSDEYSTDEDADDADDGMKRFLSRDR